MAYPRIMPAPADLDIRCTTYTPAMHEHAFDNENQAQAVVNTWEKSTEQFALRNWYDAQRGVHIPQQGPRENPLGRVRALNAVGYILGAYKTLALSKDVRTAEQQQASYNRFARELSAWRANGCPEQYPAPRVDPRVMEAYARAIPRAEYPEDAIPDTSVRY